MSSESPRLSGEAYAVERLRDNPQLDYETLRKEAEQDGLAIQPIQYGRARRQLGLTGVPPTVPPAAASAESGAAAADSGAQAQPAAKAAEPQTAESQTTESQTTAEPRTGEPRTGAPAKTGTPTGSPAGQDAQPAASAEKPDPAASGTSAGHSGTPAGNSVRPKSTPAFEFLVESLRAEPTISYGELKARADGLDLKIAPIMYGRAKALLGLVPVRPRGQGKNRKQPAASAATPTLPPAKASTPSQFSKQLERVRNVDDLVQIVKHLDGERRRLRSLLEQIANSIDAALDYDDDAS